MGLYLSQKQIEARVGRDIVRQIYDDNNDGTADGDPIAQLIADVEATIDSALRPVYPIPLTAPIPRIVTKIALDLAYAMACVRFPSYLRVDGVELLKMAKQDLNDIRMGKTRLDVQGFPEPAANEGGTVRSGNPISPTPPKRVFADGTFDF